MTHSTASDCTLAGGLFANPNIRCDPLSITPKPHNGLARAAFSEIELVVISLEDRPKYWPSNYISINLKPHSHLMKIPVIAAALFLSTVFGGLFGTAQSHAQPAFPQGPGPQHRAVNHQGVNYYAVVPNAPRDDIMDTTGHGLLYYRRIMRQGTTPTVQELNGQWRGVNRGIVEVAGYNQFIKDIRPQNGRWQGDNIQVKQVKSHQVRYSGWQPVIKKSTMGYNPTVERRGQFAVRGPNYRGPFGHGADFSYRDGGNPKNDPARLLQDRVTKIDDNHMIGRATANFGPIRIPLSYFVLERVE